MVSSIQDIVPELSGVPGKSFQQFFDTAKEETVGTVSACLIVRDEEEYLPDCLDSIRGWVDEIIVVDTGSSDKTVTIAESRGAKIYRQKWKKDFSYHRNYSISKATKDWVFIIDADERVIPGHGENLKKMLPDIKQNLIAVEVFNLYGQPRVAKGRSSSVRVFKRSAGYKYQGAFHNELLIHTGAEIYKVPFRINHFGYDLPPAEMAKKYNRLLDMSRSFTEREPRNPKAWFHLVRTLKIKDGKLNEEAKDDIFDALDKGLSLTNGVNDENNLHIQLLNLMAWMKHYFQEHEEAITYAKKALVFKPDYLDAIFAIAMANTYGVNAEEGERWLLRYLREQEIYNYASRIDSISMEHANERPAAYKALMEIEQLKAQRSLNA